jgi:hypothetical protein
MEGLREEEEAVSARLRSPPRGGLSRLALAVAGGLALAGAGASARADDQPEAVRLFDKARSLMQNAATLAEACRTLEESLKLWDRGDTVLNLALCHRRQGKTATAWAEFDKAISHGTKVGFPEAIEEAKRQRAELEAILSRLTVTVPPVTAALDGLTVEVDGEPLPRERWNIVFVRDPGPVRVRAQARGHKPFEVQVELGAKKDAKSVVVVLEVEPPPLPPTPPPQPRPIAKPPRPVWPWVVGGAGVALGAAAVGSEILSLSAHKELDTKCGPARQSCPPGYDFHAARGREVLGFGLFVGLGAGGVLALGAAGVGLGLSSARAKQAPVTSFVVSPTSIGVHSAF